MPLSHAAFGSGDPVLLLHGLFGAGRNWTAVAKRLAAHHHVLAVDLRNHGESFWDDRMDYLAMAEDLRDVIRRHVQGPATVIGHSMGGKAAMVLALTHPELVRRLVVVDIAPVAYAHSFAAYADAMAAVPVAALSRRSEADAHLAAAVPDPGVRAFLLQNLVAAPGGGFRWRVNLDVLRRDMETLTGFAEVGHARAYLGPTLFLAGAPSDYVEPHHHARIAQLFPHARIQQVPGAGHWVHAEAPGAFLDQVSAFLAT